MNDMESIKRRDIWTTRNVAVATICVVAVALLFFALYRLRMVVFLTTVAVVLGTAIRPAVNRLQARGVLRPVGVFAIYILLALVVFGVMVLVVPLVADQGMELLRNVPKYYETLRAGMLDSRSRIFTNLALRLPVNPALFPKKEPTVEQTINQVGQTYSVVFMALRIFLGAVAVLLVGFYWALEGDQVVGALLRLSPPPHRVGIRNFSAAAERKLGGFMRGQGILSLTVGAAAFLAYSLIGLPFAFVLAVIAGTFELIPFFGPILGAVPALLVSLSFDASTAVWVVVATGIIQFVENVWLVPRVMNHSMGVNPIVTLLCLATFSSVLGFAGAVLALPLAAVIQVALDRFTAEAAQIDPNPPGPHVSTGGEIETIVRDMDRMLRDLGAE